MILRAVGGNRLISLGFAQMRAYSTKPLTAIFDRGFVKEFFPKPARGEVETLLQQPQTIYAGFDPTADSLHVGNLLALIGLLHFQRAGHQPIALVGGATGRIGDPSGRTTERSVIEADELNHNLKCIEQQIRRIFGNHRQYLWNESTQGKLKPVKVINNEKFYKNLTLVDFITDIGRMFRISKMLKLTSVKTRINSGEGMSFTEFSYQLCQSYDWLQLYKKENCRLQLGGIDQLGNMSHGVYLIKKMTGQSDAYGLTIPLLTNGQGDKFGKSAGNAIWLDADKTSPFSLYQYLIRTPDDEIENLLKVFTLYSPEEMEAIMNDQNQATHLRKAPQRLAEQMTLLIHGEAGLKQAKLATAALYDGDFAALSALTPEDMIGTFAGATVHKIMLEPGMTMMDLVKATKLFKKDGDATRTILQGGFYINQNRCTNVGEIISPTVHILANQFTLLRTGKRNYHIVQWIN